MKKLYILSIMIGAILLFILQLFSYVNYILIENHVYSGLLDSTLLLKTSLLIIPCLFIVAGLVGLLFPYLKDKI
ncbi:hypothetical protein ACFO26_04450 [Lactococcus nasutitermitis]|uniref:DUF3955 domain-containing protein n=1 Tax=Lactococcus nasutitermitis TaxID=1652957 RepID=A0ABV9JCG7_9LACT|nr:hypothetical protein [Lactococcus nasutitermitis]